MKLTTWDKWGAPKFTAS